MSGQTEAQQSLMNLENALLDLEEWEKQEIEKIRDILRAMVQTYESSAELAILAISFEIAIKEKQ